MIRSALAIGSLLAFLAGASGNAQECDIVEVSPNEGADTFKSLNGNFACLEQKIEGMRHQAENSLITTRSGGLALLVGPSVASERKKTITVSAIVRNELDEDAWLFNVLQGNYFDGAANIATLVDVKGVAMCTLAEEKWDSCRRETKTRIPPRGQVIANLTFFGQGIEEFGNSGNFSIDIMSYGGYRYSLGAMNFPITVR